ncbi:MAG: CBS domain containing membrane protein [Desulfobulbaceae bacterium BRH_c16a]|nr:MAG: CBS domain containing membrane protein [Desulfobulbaceae bacterium BRH_c16a]
MFVSGRMSKELITAGPDVTIFEARTMMTEKNIRHLPVVDAAGKLIGIVTDRDVRDAMPSTLLKKTDYELTLAKIMNYPIGDIMTKNPMTIKAYYTIQDSLLVMQKKKVGALPVVDEEGYLKGILSTRDLLTAFVNIMNIDEPGTLLCIVVKEQRGQMKKIVDIITEEKISLGSVLVARFWDEEKRAIFPYLLTNNVINVKKKLLEVGFEIIDPMKWYLEQLPKI